MLGGVRTLESFQCVLQAVEQQATGLVRPGAHAPMRARHQARADAYASSRARLQVPAVSRVLAAAGRAWGLGLSCDAVRFIGGCGQRRLDSNRGSGA